MNLAKLNKIYRNRIAELLADYWKERGLPQYDEKWAKDYLIKGHKKEIKKDEFFIYKQGKKLIGVISLIIDVSNVAEIRDEVIFSDYDKIYLKNILLEIIKIAEKRKLRKIYSLVLRHNIKYYKELGFKKEGFLKNHFVKGENLTIMSKIL